MAGVRPLRPHEPPRRRCRRRSNASEAGSTAAVNNVKDANDRDDIAKAGALAGATVPGQRAQAQKELRAAVEKGVKDVVVGYASGKVLGKGAQALPTPKEYVKRTLGNALNSLVHSNRQERKN